MVRRAQTPPPALGLPPGVKLGIQVIGALITLSTVTFVPALTAYVTITSSSARLETRLDAVDKQNTEILRALTEMETKVTALGTAQAGFTEKLTALKEQQASGREQLDQVKERLDRTVEYILQAAPPSTTGVPVPGGKRR